MHARHDSQPDHMWMCKLGGVGCHSPIGLQHALNIGDDKPTRTQPNVKQSMTRLSVKAVGLALVSIRTLPM
eukprot:1367060-Amphidinium_carterae.3